MSALSTRTKSDRNQDKRVCVSNASQSSVSGAPIPDSDELLSFEKKSSPDSAFFTSATSCQSDPIEIDSDLPFQVDSKIPIPKIVEEIPASSSSENLQYADSSAWSAEDLGGAIKMYAIDASGCPPSSRSYAVEFCFVNLAQFLKSERKNCLNNLNCWHHLGFDKKYFDNELSVVSKVLGQDPRSLRRPPNTLVGLKNLGATCYVNSLLQALYMLVPFRSIVFAIDCSLIQGEDRVIMQELQTAFVFLQYSKLTVFNPVKLVEALRLDKSVQQDCQEFNKLFLEKIDSVLKIQSHLQSQFKGLFAGVVASKVVCRNCRKSGSTKKELFSELMLQIKGMTSLSDSISAYFQSSPLDGGNKWFCSHCNSKQDADRFLALEQLPPILNIQLLRFSFDFHEGRRKKVQDPIIIPETIRIPSTVPDSSSPSSSAESILDVQYELVAILRHQGSSATCGHYVAEAKDASGAWWRFDDERVTKLAASPASRDESLDETVNESSTSPASIDLCDGFDTEEETLLPSQTAAASQITASSGSASAFGSASSSGVESASSSPPEAIQIDSDAQLARSLQQKDDLGHDISAKRPRRVIRKRVDDDLSEYEVEPKKKAKKAIKDDDESDFEVEPKKKTKKAATRTVKSDDSDFEAKKAVIKSKSKSEVAMTKAKLGRKPKVPEALSKGGEAASKENQTKLKFARSSLQDMPLTGQSTCTFEVKGETKTPAESKGSRNAYMLIYVRSASRPIEIPEDVSPTATAVAVAADASVAVNAVSSAAMANAESQFQTQLAAYDQRVDVLRALVQRRRADLESIAACMRLPAARVKKSKGQAELDTAFNLVPIDFLRQFATPPFARIAMHSFASRTSEAKTSSDTKASEVQMSEVQTSDMTIVEETSAEETADFLSLYPPRASLSSAMTELLCAHHKANPEAVSKMKRISREAWNLIVKTHPSPITLNETDLCPRCFSEFQIHQHQRSSRQQAAEQLSDWLGVQQTESPGALVPSKLITAFRAAVKKAKESSRPLDLSSILIDLYYEIFCSHHKVKEEAYLRKGIRVIDPNAWTQLLSFFPSWSLTPLLSALNEDALCVECSELSRIASCADEEKQEAKDLLFSQLKIARNFFKKEVDLVAVLPGIYHIVPLVWFEQFELFLTLHGERPSLIDYTALICPHSRLRAGVWPRGVEVALDDTEPHVIAHLGSLGESVRLVTPDFMQVLREHSFTSESEFCCEVRAPKKTSRKDLPYVPWKGIHISMSPKFCIDCAEKRYHEAFDQKLSYQGNGTLLFQLQSGSSKAAPRRPTRESRNKNSSFHLTHLSDSDSIKTLKMRFLELDLAIENLGHLTLFNGTQKLTDFDTLKTLRIPNGATLSYLIDDSNEEVDSHDFGPDDRVGPELGFALSALRSSHHVEIDMT